MWKSLVGMVKSLSGRYRGLNVNSVLDTCHKLKNTQLGGGLIVHLKVYLADMVNFNVKFLLW